jgi:hypothetical protein
MADDLKDTSMSQELPTNPIFLYFSLFSCIFFSLFPSKIFQHYWPIKAKWIWTGCHPMDRIPSIENGLQEGEVGQKFHIAGSLILTTSSIHSQASSFIFASLFTGGNPISQSPKKF